LVPSFIFILWQMHAKELTLFGLGGAFSQARPPITNAQDCFPIRPPIANASRLFSNKTALSAQTRSGYYACALLVLLVHGLIGRQPLLLSSASVRYNQIKGDKIYLIIYLWQSKQIICIFKK